MFTFEALTVVYALALAAASLVLRGERRARGRAALLAAGLAVLAAVASRTLGADARGWLGHLYLVAGYWLPALLAPGPAGSGFAQADRGFEAWLVRTEASVQRLSIVMPRWTREGVELAYLLCYPIVPLSFWMVWAWGGANEVDRYWTAVLLAGFACYGTLPWLVSRPPRIALPPSAQRVLASQRANLFTLSRVSHGLNTFPSGHVAVSFAAAVIVCASWPAAGMVLLAAAAAIAAGAVAGRYHYVVDVPLGLVVGLAAGWLVLRLA